MNMNTPLNQRFVEMQRAKKPYRLLVNIFSCEVI